MDVVVTVVMMDTILLIMEADMVRHMQQEVPTVIVVVIMALPSVIQLVIVVILKHDSIHICFLYNFHTISLQINTYVYC